MPDAIVDSKEEDKEQRLAKASKVVKKLGQRKMGNAFVALRKIALHPLLARRIYTGSQMQEIAKIALRRSLSCSAVESMVNLAVVLVIEDAVGILFTHIQVPHLNLL